MRSKKQEPIPAFTAMQVIETFEVVCSDRVEARLKGRARLTLDELSQFVDAAKDRGCPTDARVSHFNDDVLSARVSVDWPVSS